MADNRIWIELERPLKKDPSGTGHERAALANSMLKRLAAPDAVPLNLFWWSEDECSYCYGSRMGYEVLKDSGVWLDLNFVGR